MPTQSPPSFISSLAARHDELVSTLAEHVAIPTGHSDRPGLDEYRGLLAERLKGLGATIELRAGESRPWWLDHSGRSRAAIEAETEEPLPVLIARKQTGHDSPRVMIAGHLDTVHDPKGSFREMTIDGAKKFATGPGVVDMKGGVLIAIAALEALAEAGVDCNWTVVLNGDEETGSFQSAGILHDVAGEHDLGIAVEPALADGSLAIERMGSGQCMIEVFGRSAHVGREFEKGLSAVTKLAEVLLMLSKMARPSEGRIVNAGPLKGGVVTNAVPDYAACWVNVRYRDAEAGDVLGRMIDELATAEEEVPRVVVHRRWNRPAKPATDAVAAFARGIQAAAAALGQELPFASTGGVCDGNIMQAAGLPTLDTLGVRGGNLHRPDEFIELASLVDRSQLLATVLSRIAAGELAVPDRKSVAQ